MTITHFPSDATLAAFTAGNLDEGRSLVVATHLALCPQSRARVNAFAHAGGEFLNRIEPTPMRSGAVQKALARLDDSIVSIGAKATQNHDKIHLPEPLNSYHLGAWQRIGGGVRLRTVSGLSDQESRVFMLYAEPGTRLPHHRHTGKEWTCVFQGAFTHAHGRFGAGDFDEADETVEHHPTVGSDEACICLVALQGQILFQGWFGRLLQPFVRI